MTHDANKQLSNIAYDLNNMPTHIELSDYDNFMIDYIYTAQGEKLKKLTRKNYETIEETNYMNNFVYKNGNLSYVITQQGKISFPPGEAPLYQYFIKDHLGNTRAVVDEEGQLVQQSSYYPFGPQADALTWSSDMHPENEYLYNSKELQDDFGLDWYDYGARMYDAALGRFICLDPISDEYNYVTPYNYAENDPVSSIDLWGLQKYKISSNMSLTSGKIGIKGKFFGVIGLGGSYTKGGNEQTIEIYYEVDIESGEMNVGVAHTQNSVLNEGTLSYGPFHASEGEEKKTRRELNLQEGATKPIDDKTYKEYITGGIGPVKTKNKEEEKETTKFESGLEVNALIIGIEAGWTLEKTEEHSNQKNEAKNSNNKTTKENEK